MKVFLKDLIMEELKKDYLFEPFKITEVKYRSCVYPRPRSGHRIACDDSHVYCFGGYNPSLPLTSVERENPTWSPNRPLFRELWSFSMASCKWTLHRINENMPDELASNAMSVYGKYLMIYGGTGDPFGHKCSVDVIVWRTNENETKFDILDVSGNRPPGQYGQAVLCHNGYFYTVGGTNGFAYNCDIYRLDLQSLKWEPVFVGTGQEDEPLGRYRHEIVRNGNKIYIIGGGTGESAFELTEIPMYDLDSNTWHNVLAKPDPSLNEPLAPVARKCHCAAQVNTPSGVDVYVAGGSDGQSVFNDIWRLSIPTMQWTLMKKTTLPHPLYFHSSAVTSAGCMYIFGGIEPKDAQTIRNNVLYKMWLCIPKLSEMCFEALLHFHPDLEQINEKTLARMGIPNHFLKRMHPPRN